ncbi:synaptobrevin-domain-containing protein [Entophlyctis helioformis]|nr:synaptobrevin-domain-containing protein [Entophlyctis helioformis]
MPLVYALVARGSAILAEHAITTGNFTTITQHILDQLASSAAASGSGSGSGLGSGSGSGSGSTAAGGGGGGGGGDVRTSYVYDRFLFHTLQRGGLTFMCLADDQFGRKVPFAFLDDMAARYVAVYARSAATAPAYGHQEYGRTIAALMEQHSSGTAPSTDKFAAVQSEIDAVRGIMVDNIEKVLARGERIDLLVDKTESLTQASFAFKKRSTQLKRAMWYKNARLVGVMVVAALLVLYFLVGAACGFPGFHDCLASRR